MAIMIKLSMAAPILRMELHRKQIQNSQVVHLNLVRQFAQENSAIENYLDPMFWPENKPQPEASSFSDILEQIWRLPHQLLTPPADVKERFARSSRDELGYAEWLVEISM
jgi:hypothetical protein